MLEFQTLFFDRGFILFIEVVDLVEMVRFAYVLTDIAGPIDVAINI